MCRTTLNVCAKAAACAALLLALPVAAQRPEQGTPPTLIPVDNGNPALITDRHLAAQTAGYRALHYCSAIFSAGLPENLIEESMSQRAARDVETIVDREHRTVAVPYASDMPPRIAAWRPGLGGTQLPVGATMDLAARLPRLPDSVSVPNFDDGSGRWATWTRPRRCRRPRTPRSQPCSTKRSGTTRALTAAIPGAS